MQVAPDCHSIPTTVVTAVLAKLIGMASCASYIKFKKCIRIYMNKPTLYFIAPD